MHSRAAIVPGSGAGQERKLEMQQQIQEIQSKLSKKLSEKRFTHTIGVLYTAEALAMRYGEDLDKAAYAAVLHDCAKYCSGEQMLQKCRKYNIEISEVEQKNPSLLHAKLGVYYAKHRYEIDDEQILAAIRWHTTGRPEMTLLEKIVFLADYIEPNRKLIPGLTQIRQIAFCDIDKAVCMTLENTVSYLKGSSRGMKCFDPNTKQAYEYYKQYQ